MLTIVCFREHEPEMFRWSMGVKHKVIGHIRVNPDCGRFAVRDLSTKCKVVGLLSMVIFRRLLSETIFLYQLDEVNTIDAFGFYGVATSRRYARRINYQFLEFKPMLLPNCPTGTILDVQCRTIRLYVTQIGGKSRQVIWLESKRLWPIEAMTDEHIPSSHGAELRLKRDINVPSRGFYNSLYTNVMATSTTLCEEYCIVST